MATSAFLHLIIEVEAYNPEELAQFEAYLKSYSEDILVTGPIAMPTNDRSNFYVSHLGSRIGFMQYAETKKALEALLLDIHKGRQIDADNRNPVTSACLVEKVPNQTEEFSEIRVTHL